MRKSERLISSLNDSCFVHAGECLRGLCQMIEKESGIKPSLNDLCEILAAALRCCSPDMLSDVDVQAVEKLTAEVAPHRKVSLKPGDVLAVPREKGGYYFIIYVTSNQFGHAFGMFGGYGPVPRLSATWEPVPVGVPVYTGRS